MKSNQFNTEEAVLQKAFKYFDLNNNGTCEPAEFAKVVEKIGVALPSQKEVGQIFAHYDVDGSGFIDYKEFTSVLCGGKAREQVPPISKKNDQFGSGLGYKKGVDSSV
jgi:Ca2+-binding EF-hand superfamily protein